MPLFGESNFLQALGWAVLNSLWQMAFLWVVFQATIAFGINKPSRKSRLATIAITLGFFWFLATLLNHWIINPGADKRSLFTIANFAADQVTGWQEKLKLFLPYASFIYLFLLIFPVYSFIRNYRFVQTIRREGLSKADVDMRMFVRRLAERMGIRKPVHVYISSLITSPVTVGFFKPIILMPIAAITHLSAKQVEAILLHELSHIRRYDYFINLWINLVRTVLYFNPFVKLFSKTIEREREKSCDELVIQFQYDPFGYASALLALEKNSRYHNAMAIAASGQRNDLLHRVERILGVEQRQAPDFRKISGLLLGLLCVIGMNAMFFFSSPIIRNHSLAITPVSNPFYQLLFDGGGKSLTADKNTNNKKPATKPAIAVSTKTTVNAEAQTTEPGNIPPLPAAPFMNVDARTMVMPQLDKEQEAQVQEAVAATKKVMQETQWRQVEKKVADAMTEFEKQNLKQKYYNDIEKQNWKTLEDKLRLSYDNINWPQVNSKLDAAVNTIIIDSLKQSYSSVLSDLNKVETWMNENNCDFIPDTDLKLQEIQAQKEKVEQQLKLINAVRKKKIIHL